MPYFPPPLDVTLSGNTTGTLTLVKTGTLTLAGGNNVTLSQSGNAVTISAFNQTVQTQNLVDVTLAGNTAGALALVSSGTLTLAGGNNITLSQNGNAVTISAANEIQTVQTLGLYGSSQTLGQSSSSTYDARSLTVVGSDIVSIGWSNGSLILDATTTPQSVQTQNLFDLTLSGNTSGTLALVSSGTLTLAGGNNITLSQNGNAVTISGPNTSAQSNQTLGIYGSSQTVGQSSSSTYDARSLTIVGSDIISVGWTNGSLVIDASAAQTVQTQNLFDLTLAGNTTGTLALVSSGTATLAGGNNITLSQSGNHITISAFNQTVQTQNLIDVTLAGNTTGTLALASSGTLTLAGGNNITLSQSGNAVTISAFNQTVQTQNLIDITLAGNTTGTLALASSGTLTLAGGNNVTLSQNGNAVTISAFNQTVQTQNLIDVTLAGNTTGTLALASSGTLTLAGGNNITLSQNGNAVTISAFNQTVQTQNLIDLSLAGNTTGTLTLVSSGTAILAGGNNITLSQNGQSITISAFTQTNQTVGLYGVGNTTQNSSTTLDARTISFNAQGPISVGFSNGSVDISAPYQYLSFYEPQVVGQTMTAAMTAGTVYFQPFSPEQPITAYRLAIPQSITSQGTSTQSYSAKVSSSFTSSTSGSWGQSATILLFSRQSTGTNANSSNIITFFSTTGDIRLGMSNSWSNSSNVSSASMTVSTKGGVTYLANIDTAGGYTTSSQTTSGTTSFSSTGTANQTFSSSFGQSIGNSYFTGIRPFQFGFATSLPVDEYWLGIIFSTNSTNLSVVNMGIGSVLGYTDVTQGYMEYGNTTTVGSSNVQQGWGSYSASSNTTAAIPLTNISGMSNIQSYFNIFAGTK